MVFRRNGIAILVLDFFALSLFLIPLLISRISKRGRAADPRRILIIELWGIGDLVMMSAILKPLKDRYPYSEITLLSKTHGKELFGESGYIREFIEIDLPWTRFTKKYHWWSWDWKWLLATIRRLRKQKFDLIIDARGDIRNNLLSFLIGGRRRIGYDWFGGGFFLTEALSRSYKGKHRVEAWANILFSLRLTTEHYLPYLTVSERQNRFAENFLKEHGIKDEDLVIGIHPGAAIKNRCWPMERFAYAGEQIRDTYNARVIVFIEPGGYGDSFPMKGNFIKAKVTLYELVALIKNIDILLCNDSGAMHIATAVATPLIAIFGPGDVQRVGPFNNSEALVIQKDFTCRPCFDNCKYDKALCLDAINTEEVITAFERIVKNRLKQVHMLKPNLIGKVER